VTLFDYVVLFILVCSIIISTMRGFLKEILSLVSWIAAFVIANAYSTTVAEWLPSFGHVVRLIVAFLILFIGVKLLMALLMMAVDSTIKASGFRIADRGLGGLFGFARGCVIVLAAAFLCGLTAIPQQAFWKNAVLSPMVETAARTVKPMLPGSLSKHVHF
jgi:membrane protein required for colicin V production